MTSLSSCQVCNLQVPHQSQELRLEFETHHHRTAHPNLLAVSPLYDEADGIQWFGQNSTVARLPAPDQVFLLTRPDGRKVAVTSALFNAMRAFQEAGGLDSPLTKQNRRTRTPRLS